MSARKKSPINALRSLLPVLGLSLLIPLSGWAQASGEGGSTQKPEEDDYRSTPHLEYGEFNETESENETALFYQYGRFFGVSVGAGFSGATGNRGALWRGGFPQVDFKVVYWFDFQVALALGFSSAPHYYSNGGSRSDVTLSRLGLDLRYYFDTTNASAAVTFANPYIFLGIGNFRRQETQPLSSASTANDNSAVFSVGAGFEFPIKTRSSYFNLEARLSTATFTDDSSPSFASQGIPDLTGLYFSIIGGVLFTW